MADWEGKTLGKVHINDLIARGGMAEVYTGTHESFGQVAVKVMRGLLERDSEQLARFKREAEVIEELRHPNIVQMFDYTVVDETPCLTMEYIPGPALAAYLRTLHDHKQRLPIGIVAHILQSLASALDYAHAKGMVHRDIKPANVLLRSETEVIEPNKPLPQDVEPVLTDFGLVRLLDSTMHTTAGSVSGTPTYMSPEQARGEKVDKHTDIYSLAIMLYEMLAGSVPFQSDTTFGMLMKHINEPPPPIKGISGDLQALLDRALAKDPSMRYPSAGAMADEFMALFNGQTISPGTMHIAEMARRAAEASKQAQPQERRSTNWRRIGLELAAVLGLGFLLFRFVLPTTNSASLTPAALDQNVSVGRVRFDDFNFYMDSAILTLNNVPQPGEGQHLEAWLRGQNGQSPTIRDIGKVEFIAASTGRLEITDPKSENFLLNFDEVLVTVEQDADDVSEPTGEVVYSSVFPPQAFVHVSHLVVAFDGVPENEPLMQSLWYYGAWYPNRSIKGDPADKDYLVGMMKAYQDGDEALIRKRTEEVINLLVGDLSDQYQDYNGDGEKTDSGHGYGSLSFGDRVGYLGLTALHAKNAAEAPDSTSNIRSANESLQVCLQNMEGWTNELLTLALQLNETPFGSEMEPIINQMIAVSDNLLTGVDADGNQIIEAISGECGAEGEYHYALDMADMLIYPGADRVPPTGK